MGVKVEGGFWHIVLLWCSKASSSTSFPWKSIWGVKAPRRVSFLCLDDYVGEDSHRRLFEAKGLYNCGLVLPLPV